MADAYTGTAASNFDQGAYDRLAYMAFRPNNYFDQVADVMPTNQSMPGTSVTFTQVNDLTPVSSTLSEAVDVDAVALSDSQVSVTLAEYGNATITTAKLRGTSFVPIDPIQAEVIGVNGAQSLDLIAVNQLKAGTNVIYAGSATSRTTIAAGSTLTAAKVRAAYNKLERANTPKINGYYVMYIHPDVKLDLRAETGAAAWRDPHTYSQPDAIWTGEIGEFEGFRFISTTTAPLVADASNGAGSTGTVDAYLSIACGRQALAKAYSNTDGNGSTPRVVPGPITDKLRRFVPLGWYWLGGYGRFRENSLVRIESSSSVGVNT